MSNAKIEANKPDESARRELSLSELETVSAAKGASSGKTNSGATFLNVEFKQADVTSF
jgi:hypothetical protein